MTCAQGVTLPEGGVRLIDEGEPSCSFGAACCPVRTRPSEGFTSTLRGTAGWSLPAPRSGDPTPAPWTSTVFGPSTIRSPGPSLSEGPVQVSADGEGPRI